VVEFRPDYMVFQVNFEKPLEVKDENLAIKFLDTTLFIERTSKEHLPTNSILKKLIPA
jgi:hypothetical protein